MTSKIADDLQILPIGAIAQALNIKEKDLLSYNKKGIVKPRNIKGKPYYSFNDLETIKKYVMKG